MLFLSYLCELTNLNGLLVAINESCVNYLLSTNLIPITIPASLPLLKSAEPKPYHHSADLAQTGLKHCQSTQTGAEM